jgi:hypothetical protein
MKEDARHLRGCEMEEIKKVLVSDPLSNQGLEILGRAKNLRVDLRPGLSPEELKNILPEYDGIIIRSETKLKADIIEAGKRLKVIGRAGIGLDNVDLPAATKNEYSPRECHCRGRTHHRHDPFYFEENSASHCFDESRQVGKEKVYGSGTL